ncbi:MAG TPA: hypothetical protein VNH41_00405 [Steroidobacteraceae bacterium]|nr:hypothetical protein [Steroidobacteraceae bacterium]
MPVIPYVKQGAPFADTAGASGTVNAAKLNAIDNGIFEAMQQPAVRVTHSTTQSITSAVITALAFNTERFDQAGGSASTMHDTVTNNSRLTAVYAGVYQISGAVEFAANAVGERLIQVRHQGATVIARQEFLNTGSAQALAISTLYPLAMNEYVELMVYQNSGSAVVINASGNYSPEFMMVRVA